MEDLRLENDALKKRLAEMTAEAANNESILKRTQGRELTLLRADGLGRCCTPWSTVCASPMRSTP